MARECEHLEFSVHADVNRLTASDGGQVSGYAVDITINCAECGLPFAWRGLPFGLSPMEPRLSFDGLELRAPITPFAATQEEIDRVHDLFMAKLAVAHPNHPWIELDKRRKAEKASGGDGG